MEVCFLKKINQHHLFSGIMCLETLFRIYVYYKTFAGKTVSDEQRREREQVFKREGTNI